MSRIKLKHRKGKLSFSIIVDGETEVWYFQMMKKHEKLPRIDIYPEVPKKKHLEEQYKAVKEKAAIYDKVIWIIDIDTLLKEDKERKVSKHPALTKLRYYIASLNKEFGGIVEVVFNNPCLEFWFLLHYVEKGKYYSDCSSVIKDLRSKFITDYKKTERYFKKKNNDIYLRLSSYQHNAKINALKLGRFNFDEPERSKAEMYRVLDIIGICVNSKDKSKQI